jgi:elongator complex protein 3
MSKDIEDICQLYKLAPASWERLIENQQIAVNIINEVIAKKCTTKEAVRNIVNAHSKGTKDLRINFGFLGIVYKDMVKNHGIIYDKELDQLLKKKSGRGMSGVHVVTSFLSPFPGVDLRAEEGLYEKLVQLQIEEGTAGAFSCSKNCAFCSAPPGTGRSYDPKEPGVMRAIQCLYDEILMMRSTMRKFIAIGQTPTKLEFLILGGTWSSFTREYRENFIRRSIFAANEFYSSEPRREEDMGTIAEEIEINKSAMGGIIGITIEDRPDEIHNQNIHDMRDWGITRLQIGWQHIDSDVLDRVRRGHYMSHSLRASKLLLRSCFKFDVHLMPDLPRPFIRGTRIPDDRIDMLLRDLRMAFKVCYVTGYRPDQGKIYPLAIVEYSDLMKDFEQGLYESYAIEEPTADDLQEQYDYKSYPDFDPENYTNITCYEDFLSGFFSFIKFYIEKMKCETYNKLELYTLYFMIHTPRSIRWNRIVRDIPKGHIFGGNDNVNMNQELGPVLKKLGLRSMCIRSREIGNTKYDKNNVRELIEKSYAHGGLEYFLEIEALDVNICGLLRLRIDPMAGYDNDNEVLNPEIKGCALIRELHVYGEVTPTFKVVIDVKNTQHSGFGRRLLAKAINIARYHGLKKIAVINGIGTTRYYAKIGFVEEGRYMTMNIESENPIEDFDIDGWRSLADPDDPDYVPIQRPDPRPELNLKNDDVIIFGILFLIIVLIFKVMYKIIFGYL